MSQTRIRKNELDARPSSRLWPLWVAGVVVAALLAFIGAGRISDSAVDMSHSTTPGRVLDSKLVMDHASSGQYGGTIYYRIDARVAYEINGQQQDRWLAASEVTAAREKLVAQLARHPRYCQVFWTAGHPENAKCRSMY